MVVLGISCSKGVAEAEFAEGMILKHQQRVNSGKIEKWSTIDKDLCDGRAGHERRLDVLWTDPFSIVQLKYILFAIDNEHLRKISEIRVHQSFLFQLNKFILEGSGCV